MRPAELNPSRLPFLFKREFELCAIRPDETIVLVSDLKVRPEYIGAAFAAAQELGASIYEMKLNAPYSTTHIGGEHVFSVKGGIEAIEAADLCICFHIPLGSEWMARGRAAGTRFLMIYDHPDDLERLLSPPGLKEATEYAVKLVEGANELRVVSDWGTDFTAKLSPSMVTTCQYGYAEEPGRVDHWGAGHFSTWPLPNQSWGTIVLKPGDAWILPYVRYVEDETRLTIENGVITKIEGKTDAKLIRDFFAAHKRHSDDDEPYHVSHLGWGMNPAARRRDPRLRDDYWHIRLHAGQRDDRATAFPVRDDGLYLRGEAHLAHEAGDVEQELAGFFRLGIVTGRSASSIASPAPG